MSQGSNKPHREPYHRPVMVEEVVEMFLPLTAGVIVDATYGGGGHAGALLDCLDEGVRVLGIDRDSDSVGRVTPRDRLTVVQGNFGVMNEVLDTELPKMGAAGSISGVLFDFGVSSHQLDAGHRGFSYRAAAPLDMRMGPDAETSAAEIVNNSDVTELARMLATLGEERFATRVARAIAAARPIESTDRLAEVVRDAIPAAARRTGGHPARKTFQAIRMAVNDELAAITSGLDHALDALEVGGRCVAISYHSLEDRIVKRRFRRGAGRVDRSGPPVEVVADLRELTRKPLRPSEAEVVANPRARSARLRAVERVAA